MPMERDKQGPLSLSRSTSQPNGHAPPSHHLVVNHENRKPLFANPSNPTARAPGLPRSTTGFEVRYATNPTATATGPGPGPPSLARRAKSDPPGAVSEMSDGSGGVYVARKSAFRSPAARRMPGSETRGLHSLRPLSITEAFRIAEEEQQEAERQRQLGGSPSPAPRPWRARPGQPQDEIRARQLLAEDHLDSKSRTLSSNVAAMRQNDLRSTGASGLGATGATDREADGLAAAAAAAAGSPNRFGASNPSLQDRINEWRTTSRPVLHPARTGTSPEDVAEFSGNGRLPALVPGIEDVPMPSAEESPSQPKFEAASSPSKDFSWQVEQDFTAGDLQISDSPRIRVGANSNKPFANRPSIFNGINVRSPSARSPAARIKSPERSNTRITDIQQDEVKHGVDRTAGATAGLKNLTKLRQERQNFSRLNEENNHAAEEPVFDNEKAAAPSTSVSSGRSLPRPKKNEKLDTIRQLETAGLSKRALAEIRLAEIKEQNAMARPTSSETPKQLQPQPGGVGTHGDGDGGGGGGGMGMSTARANPGLEAWRGGEEGEHIPDTPVTIYKNFGRGSSNNNNSKKKQENMRPIWGTGPLPGRSGAQTDAAVKQNTTNERDLLRRLARAASASPAAPEPAGAALATTDRRAALPSHSSKSSTARPSLAAGRSIFTDLGRKSAPLLTSSSATDTNTNINTNTNLDADADAKLNLEANSRSLKSRVSSGKNNRLNIRSNDGPLTKPTVGFAGFRRANSAESVKSKPSSMQSESDPTARIDSELKLFALADNQSERGSMRAPSIGSESDREEEAEHGKNGDKDDDGGGGDDDDDDDDDNLAEATPKPQKHDFVSMPTPRITGAYVETPVTVKPVRMEGADAHEDGEEEEEEQMVVKPFKEKLKQQREREDYDEKKNQAHKSSSSTEPAANTFRDKKAAVTWRPKDEDTPLEPGARSSRSHQDEETVPAAAAAALKKKKSRSRTPSRERGPLINSAKLPSARDDLRELQRQHNMDDSTVDDVEELLAGQKRASLKIRELLEQGPSRADLDGEGVDRHVWLLEEEVKRESVARDAQEEEEEDDYERNEKKEAKEDNEEASEGQSTLVSKMDKTVRSGLSNIREAKMGIERLEGQIARVTEKPPHTNKLTKAHEHLAAHEHKNKKINKSSKVVKTEHKKDQQNPPPAACIPDSRPTSMTYLSYLWRTSPHRGLTWLRRLLLSLLIWFLAEQVLCSYYCRPSTCNVSTPCIYSYDDPTLGYALPVKLDQWFTAGQGRRFLHGVHEDLQDLLADMYDVYSGRSIQDIPVEQVPVSQRRQHWRRLRKRGLLRNASTPVGPGDPGPEQIAKWDAWRRSRLARQKAREGRVQGEDDGEGEGDMGSWGGWMGESMAEDERVG
ncbi:hypothetical protein E4U55_007573 [Claviceps digitariae]|nr:hypothetical protein E4U55_007573 [Claviceps digitariae]